MFSNRTNPPGQPAPAAADLLELPSDFTLEQDLGQRRGVRIVRARQGSRRLHLRLDPDAAAGEALAELAVLARVRHRGIAALVEHRPLPGGGLLVAREWVEGEELASWARAHTPEEVAGVVARSTAALEFLHGHGFVHGDVTAHNILVTPDGDPVWLDFGFSRSLDDATRPEAIQGSLYGLAPELLFGEAPSVRSDLFALGAMLHALLVPHSVGPRDFYARFPRTSFLDALESSPEALPEWARDVVVSLTARDPGRRPSSAAHVGRQLASRLGIDGGAVAQEPPRAPALLGRDSWLAQLVNREVAPVARDEAAARRTWWIVVQEAEAVPEVASALQLSSSLCGIPAALLDVESGLESIDAGTRLEQWVCDQLQPDEACLVVSAGPERSWSRRALQALVHARDQFAPELCLLVVATWEAAHDASPTLEQRQLPELGVRDVLRFIEATFVGETAERLERLAESLTAASGKTTGGLQRLLSELFESGDVLPGDGGYCLRPGLELGERFDHRLSAADSKRTGDLEPALGRLLARLIAHGGMAQIRDLGVEQETGRLGSASAGAAEIMQLVDQGLARLRQSAGGLELVAEPHAWSASSERELREAHAWRAERLEEAAAPAHEVGVHRVAATGTRAAADELCQALERLRASGSAELALDRAEEALTFLRAGGQAAPETLQILEVERARAWAELGRHERALAIIEKLEPVTPELEGRMLLVRALVARYREEVDEAFALLESAARLTEEARSEAAVLRIQHLHSLGRDAEVRSEVAGILAASSGEQLTERQRIYLSSIDAVSAYRTGSADEALELTLRLIDEARQRNDRAREAALLLNLATITRRVGRVEMAEDALERLVPIYDDLGDAAGLAHALVTRAQFQRDQGELLAAEESLERALRLRTFLGDREGSVTVRGTLALVSCERGHARAAIESLAECRTSFTGAHKQRFLPLLGAREIELRRRIGQVELPLGLQDTLAFEEASDPRVLLALARAAEYDGDRERALELAERARALAASLSLGPNTAAAESFLDALGRPVRASFGEDADRLTRDLLDVVAFLREPAPRFRTDAALAFARDLEARGRDDLAARLYLAIEARARETGDGKRDEEVHGEAAKTCLARCAAGLSSEETTVFRRRLLGAEDAWAGDLVPKPSRASGDQFEARVLELLSINRLLLSQSDLSGLLGTIVEKAMEITGAERGFIVLEEEGTLRQETALDSLRGDMREPERELSQSVVQEALERMEPVCVSNAVNDPMFGGALSVIALELRSILCIPFEVEEHLRGVVYLDHRLRRGMFSEKEERLCLLLADQAALAIQQVRRRDRILELNRTLGERLARQERSLRAASTLATAAPEDSPASALVGSSEVVARVREMVQRVASSDISVLITGASGTGKEVAARMLHEMSVRSTRPFVSENCAALPASLVESELFGHERGAFTGADKARPGLVERANGGTLFLDEIGEVSLDIQVKLLRVLESRQVRRIGSDEAIDVDFRLVTATNRDLQQDVQAGRFRSDLYFRLDGVRIVMPSLSEHTEDVPGLVRHFLALEEQRTGARTVFTQAVVSQLCRRQWPGNVRELKNEVARLCVLSPGLVSDPGLVRRLSSAAMPGANQEVLPLAEVERRCIVSAIAQTGGDKTRAAKLLGISRGKLYGRLRDYAAEDEARGQGPQ